MEVEDDVDGEDEDDDQDCRNFQGKFRRSRTKGHHSQIDHKSVHQYNHVVKTLKEGNSPRPEPTWPLQGIY